MSIADSNVFLVVANGVGAWKRARKEAWEKGKGERGIGNNREGEGPHTTHTKSRLEVECLFGQQEEGTVVNRDCSC